MNIIDIINAENPASESFSAESLHDWKFIKDKYCDLLQAFAKELNRKEDLLDVLKQKDKLKITQEAVVIIELAIQENVSYIYNSIIVKLEELIKISELEFQSKHKKYLMDCINLIDESEKNSTNLKNDINKIIKNLCQN